MRLVSIARSLLSVVVVLDCSACAISTKQEVDLGETYSAQINRQLPIVRDAEINRYVNVLGDSIARLSDQRTLDWRFFVVDSREVNAFAVPGGYIYVNRGLIERASTMNLLAGVLAHEIAHVTQRHSVKQIRDQERATAGLTLACVLTGVCGNGAADAAIQVGGGALFAKFSRDAESEADTYAVSYLVKAKIDPRGIPAMFRILLNERESANNGVDAWFRTHPLEADRIAATEAKIAALSAATLKGLATDSPRFQAFRDRVRNLPARAGQS